MNYLNKNVKTILLIAVFLLLFLKELILVFAIPAWHNHDEPTHFLYVQYLVEEKRLPVYQGAYVNRELSFSEEYARSEQLTDATRLMTGRNRYFRLVHQRFESTFLNYPAIGSELSGLSRQPLSQETTSGQFDNLYYTLPRENQYKNAAAIYQPLYYLLLTIPYKLFYDQDILVRLYALRIFSSLLYLAAVYICYLTASLLTKNFKFSLALAVIIGLMPVFGHLMAGINNDALLILMACFTFYYCIRLIQNFSLKNAIGLGITLGLGMLSKPHFAVFPLLALWPFIYQFKQGMRWPVILKYFVICVGLTILISGWWFAWSYSTNNSQLFGPSGPPSELVSYNFPQMITLYFQRWLYAFITYNFAFGFATEMTLPTPIIIILTPLIIFGALGLIKYIISNWKSACQQSKTQGLFLTFSFILLEVLFLYLYTKNIQTGRPRFPTDGRYFFPLIFVFSFFWLKGLAALVPKKFQDWLYFSLINLFIIIFIISLFQVIIPSFYL